MSLARSAASATFPARLSGGEWVPLGSVCGTSLSFHTQGLDREGGLRQPWLARDVFERKR